MAVKPPISCIEKSKIRIQNAGIDRLETVMKIMHRSFSNEFGESWNERQCLSMLAMPGTKLVLASVHEHDGFRTAERECAFAILRAAAQEQELLMIAVDPDCQNNGVGSILLEHIINEAANDDVTAIFLEVRESNPAQKLYCAHGFKKIGRRASYYTGQDSQKFDAITFRKDL